MIAHDVINFDHDDIAHHSKHLSQTFSYFAKEMMLELIDERGQIHECQTTVVCVDNWANSPFVAINPARTLLVGRRILLKLRPRLILDFDVHWTEIVFKETPS